MVVKSKCIFHFTTNNPKLLECEYLALDPLLLLLCTKTYFECTFREMIFQRRQKQKHPINLSVFEWKSILTTQSTRMEDIFEDANT